MSNVGRHIAKYRKAKGLTQEELSERLYVTRQTISSWENGRTLPDIQMIAHIAESLDISVEQIIYGRPVKEEPRDLSRYKRSLFFSGLTVTLCICAGLLLRPHIGYTKDTYRILPELLCLSIFPPLAYISGAIGFLSALSLTTDLSVRHSRLKLLCGMVGIGTLLAFLYTVLTVYSVLPGGSWVLRSWFWVVHHPFVFLLTGVCLFFGWNSRS